MFIRTFWLYFRLENWTFVTHHQQRNNQVGCYTCPISFQFWALRRRTRVDVGLVCCAFYIEIQRKNDRHLVICRKFTVGCAFPATRKGLSPQARNLGYGAEPKWCHINPSEGWKQPRLPSIDKSRNGHCNTAATMKCRKYINLRFIVQDIFHL